MARKLPIGIQDFASLREDGYVYVDKTAFVYKLAHEGKPYFLSRPRRFGKSLLVSTLRAYYEGRRELFEGLEIEELEGDGPNAWQPHAVFHFDFNGGDYTREGGLEAVLDARLRDWEKAYGVDSGETPLGHRFHKLLSAAHARMGCRCVVLVDEYDKPLLEAMGDTSLQERNRAVFKSFFSVLKSADEHLSFVFITGVTKFSKVSIFSDLNQLRDISMNDDYAGVCGVTSDELGAYFGDEVDRLAEARDLPRKDCLARLAKMYDGYRFSSEGPDVYNPFSLFNAFADRKLGAYWFETGTPTFLVGRLREVGFDVRKLTDGTIWATERRISDYRIDDPDPVPLLYQAGYLTVKEYDELGDVYRLCVPNDEVRYGLAESLLAEFAPPSITSAYTGADIYALRGHVDSGDTDGMRDVLAALFASIPYTRADDPFENYFQAVIYLVFTLLGRFASCEMHAATGRVDVIVQAERFVYLMELKRDGTAQEALAQIEERGYAAPFAADPRTLFRIGAAFDSGTRQLADWQAREG